MATIKGLTIEIGGNTQPLQKALAGVNRSSRDLQSELKQVDRMLKLDPTNTELLAQKQKILGESVATTKEKLDKLKIAAEQAYVQLQKGEIGEDQFRALQREVVKTEQSLESLEKKSKEFGSVFSQQVKEAGKSMQEVGSKISGAGKSMLPATAAITAAGVASVKMAADAEDAAGATEQIFKRSAKEMQDWAASLESYYGIASSEALEYANMMGSMLQNIGGLTEEEAAKQAQTLIKLAGDLTAMYGGTTADAVRALTGALKGNNTMLDNYGMAANDALVKAKALEMGLIRQGKEMDLAAKQAATLALIMEQSAAAQGQAAREADSASGSLRALGTEVKNISESFGKILLPTITPIVQAIADFVKWLGSLDDGIKKVIVIVAGLVAAIGPLLVLIGSTIWAIGVIMGAMGGLIVPIMAVVAAIGALISIGIGLYKDWDKIKTAAANLGKTIKDQFTKIKDTIAGVWDSVKSATKEIFANIVDIVKDALSGLIDSALNIGEDIVRGLWDGIMNMGSWIMDKIKGFVDGIVNGIKNVLGIHSPSRVFAGIGENMAQGLGVGFGAEINQVKKDIESAMPTNIKVNASTSSNNGGGVARESTDNLLLSELAQGFNKMVSATEGMKQAYQDSRRFERMGRVEA